MRPVCLLCETLRGGFCVGWMYPTQSCCRSLVRFTSGPSWNKRADANPTGSASISTLITNPRTATHAHTHTHTHTHASSRATKHRVLIVTEMQRDRRSKGKIESERHRERERERDRKERRMKK